MTDDLRTGMARALCLANGEWWDAQDFTETASGNTPEEMRQGWLDLADAAIAHYTAHLESEDMVEIGAIAAAKVIAERHGHDVDMWLNAERREETRAVIAAQVAAMKGTGA